MNVLVSVHLMARPGVFLDLGSHLLLLLLITLIFCFTLEPQNVPGSGGVLRERAPQEEAMKPLGQEMGYDHFRGLDYRRCSDDGILWDR